MIQKILFKNLFNSSSYEFNFEKSSEGKGSLLFLTGPNGCGKSTILKSIYTLLHNPALVDEIPPHELIQIDFDSGASVRCSPKRDPLDRPQIVFKGSKSKAFEPISLAKAREFIERNSVDPDLMPYPEQFEELQQWKSKSARDDEIAEDRKVARLREILYKLETGSSRGMTPSRLTLERLGKLLNTHIEKTGLDEFIWDGQRLSGEELRQKLRFVIETHSMNDDFSDFLSKVDVAYIPATRLHRKFLKETKSARDTGEDRIYAPVEIALENLSMKIKTALFGYQEYEGKLNNEIPQQILNLIQKQDPAENEFHVENEFVPTGSQIPVESMTIAQLLNMASTYPQASRESIAARLHKLCLIQEASDFPDISKNSLNEQFENLADQILNLIALTQVRGFMKLESIATRMEILLAVLDDLLINKNATFYNRGSNHLELGFYTNDQLRDVIEPDQLSSGEQHLIVLLERLIFDIKDGSIVLLDEPEISLHPAWQIALRELLEKLSMEKNLTIIIATHSPTLLPPFEDEVEHSKVIHLGEDL